MTSREIVSQQPKQVVVKEHVRSAPTPPKGYKKVTVDERRITTYER